METSINSDNDVIKYLRIKINIHNASLIVNLKI